MNDNHIADERKPIYQIEDEGAWMDVSALAFTSKLIGKRRKRIVYADPIATPASSVADGAPRYYVPPVDYDESLDVPPYAECAPREAQPVAKIDADGDFVWLVHNPKFAEGTEFYASPTPERADAEKDAALTDADIERIRKQPEHSQGAFFSALSFARAILAADKEKKS
jgi:hypothetical protein